MRGIERSAAIIYAAIRDGPVTDDGTSIIEWQGNLSLVKDCSIRFLINILKEDTIHEDQRCLREPSYRYPRS